MRNIVQLRKCQGNYWALCRDTIQKNLKPHPRRTKRKKKPLLHSCLPLVSFPFLPDTQPAPAPEPCQRHGCRTSEKMATKLGEFSFSTLSSCTTPFSVCCREIENKLKTYLKEDQYIWQSEQTHVFSNIPPMQKIGLDFPLGISHRNGPMPSKGGSNCWLIFYCLAMF